MTADGRKLSYSLVNNTATDFSIPRQYSATEVLAGGAEAADGAAGPSAGYNPAVAHFLSLCMKLVYEEEGIIKVWLGSARLHRTCAWLLGT